MATKFGTRATFRETDSAPVREGSKYREIVVGLEPGDVISVRLKSTQQKLLVSAEWLYGQAIKREGERLLANKRNR